MSKNLLLIAVISLSICAANAEMQSPFGSNRQMNMQSQEAVAINEAANLYSTKGAEMDITDAINENSVVPTSSHRGFFDFGQNNSGIQPAGVNDSKTIYTDEVGRLHFFGKGSVTRK